MPPSRSKVLFAHAFLPVLLKTLPDTYRSYGEPICSNTFGVHIEKADTRFHGAYPAMAQAFAAHFAMDYTYLNREEDLGIPGLRKSKLSYYPELLLEKWTATCDTPEKLL